MDAVVPTAPLDAIDPIDGVGDVTPATTLAVTMRDTPAESAPGLPVPPPVAPHWDAGILAGLNDRQRTAVLTTEGPLLVLAGAGSGKTRVLVTRIAHLVRNLGVDPAHLLGITFTKKAATEMRERLDHTLGEDVASHVTLATFHALGAMLLREYGAIIGVSAKFGIADESDVLTRVRTVLKALGVKRSAEGERPADVVQRLALAKAAFAHLAAQQAMTDPVAAEDLVNRFRTGDLTAWQRIEGALDAPNLERFAAQYAAYQAALVHDNVVDYEDLIVLPLLLCLQRPELARVISSRWRYVLVDEYQDTDFTQDHLLRVLAGDSRNLCVVGDDDQAIYSWRGAQVQNIRTFPQRYAPCNVVTLDENYRSSPVILEAANALLAARPEPGRLPKRLWTAQKEGDPIRVWTSYTQEQEAYALAADIRHALASGAIESLDDVLVLYRQNALARPVEEAFRRSNLPYRIVNGLALHERKDVRDCIAYLKVVANEYDTASFERAIGVPSRGVGPSTVEALAGYARATGRSIVAAARDADTVEGIRGKPARALIDFAALLDALTATDREQGVARTLHQLLEATGVRQAIVEELAQAEADDDDDEATALLRRLHDLEDFVLYVEEFCRADARTPDALTPNAGQFLEALATFSPDAVTGTTDDRASSTDSAPDDASPAAPPIAATGAVTCMSVHAAKGLEAPRVYVIGLEERVFPMAARPGRSGFQQIGGQGASDEMAEEGRLFYVAMTRAKRHLILSSAYTRELQRNDIKAMAKSRFLAALPETIYRAETVRS